MAGPGPYGVDEEGFRQLDELRSAARAQSESDFVGSLPVPALVMELVPQEGESGGEESSGAGRLLTLNIRSADFLPYLGRVALLAKRPGNPFPRMVSLGRTPSNDVVLKVRSVSKFHGYFECHEGRWGFTDHGSTNGSWLNGRAVKSNERQPLTAGDRLRLGLELEATFLPPAELYAYLRA